MWQAMMVLGLILMLSSTVGAQAPGTLQLEMPLKDYQNSAPSAVISDLLHDIGNCVQAWQLVDVDKRAIDHAIGSWPQVAHNNPAEAQKLQTAFNLLLQAWQLVQQAAPLYRQASLERTSPQSSSLVRQANQLNQQAATLLEKARQSASASGPTGQLTGSVAKLGEVPDSFYAQVCEAWNGLPPTDREVLLKAGVHIAATAVSRDNDMGAFAVYNPAQKLILVGAAGQSSAGPVTMTAANPDPAGSTLHEVGHALDQTRGFSTSAEFQADYSEDLRDLSQPPPAGLEHFTGPGGASETFAELYAAARGRSTSRTALVIKSFPRTWILVQHQLGLMR